MNLTVLDKIKAYKLVEIENDKKVKSLSDIESLAKSAPKVRSFYKALSNTKNSVYSLIAEIKKASPSKGLIREDFDPSEIAKAYGAEGIKIKTASELLPALAKAIENGKPTVLDVPMINNPTPTTGHWNILDIYSPDKNVSHVST